MNSKYRNVYLTVIIGSILLLSIVLMVNLTVVYQQNNAKDASDYYAKKEAFIRIQVDRTIDLIRIHKESMPKEYSSMLSSFGRELAGSPNQIRALLDGELRPEDWLKPYSEILPDLRYGILNTETGDWKTNGEDEYEAVKGQAGIAMAEFYLTDRQLMVLFIPEEGMDSRIRNHIAPVIRNIELEDNGYIWVNEVIDYDGGPDYAIRRVHANLRETEGQFLSTETEDYYGNHPYLIELNGINENGEIVFEYYFKKKDSEVISRKMTYAKLYKPFDWIVATGVHVDDMEAAISEIQSERRGEYVQRMLILSVLTLALLVLFIWKMRLSAQNIMIRMVNSSLNDELVERSRLLQETNIRLEEEAEAREIREKEISELNRNLEQQIMDRTRQLEVVNSALEEKVAQAESATEAKSRYLSVMSHEMRTPLNGIIGFIQLLRREQGTDEQKKLLEGALESSEMLLNIINDILDVEKYAAGKMTYESIGFNLKETLETGIAPFKTLAESKGLSCSRMIDSELDRMVVGDPMKIMQVVNNLVSNAIKFTEKGEVTLLARGEVGEGGLSLFIDVRDTGMGINEDVKNMLFKPFEQGLESVARNYGGTGLGLNISQEIAHHYEGTISFESEQGKGSTFHVKMILPLA